MKPNSLEFIGDRVFGIAAIRLMELDFPEVAKGNFARYCQELTTNDNFKRLILNKKHTGYLHPNSVEVLVGDIYKKQGLELAIMFAMRLLKQSKKYEEILMYNKPVIFNKLHTPD